MFSHFQVFYITLHVLSLVRVFASRKANCHVDIFVPTRLKNENLEKEGKYEKGHANVPFLYPRKTEQEDMNRKTYILNECLYHQKVTKKCSESLQNHWKNGVLIITFLPN